MAKGIKTGGRVAVNGEAKSDVMRVQPSKKDPLQRFAALLDNPKISAVALHALIDLESMVKE